MLLKLDVYSISRFNLVPHDSNVAVDMQVWFRSSKSVFFFNSIYLFAIENYMNRSKKKQNTI